MKPVPGRQSRLRRDTFNSRYGPQDAEHRPDPTRSTASADLTSQQIAEGFAADPEFRSFVEDEIRFGMFGGRGGRNPFKR